MQRINNEIAAHNAAVRKVNSNDNDNCKGLKRKRASEQIFKSEIRKWDEGKRIDWFLYRKRILFFLLYSYYKEVQRINSTQKIWLMKDNAESHSKAARYCTEYQKKHSIFKCKWPSNSSDLHSIENVWRYEKDSLKEYDLEENEKEQKAMWRAVKVITKEWEQGQTAKVTAICKSFWEKLKQCIKHEGNNNWKG